MVLDAQEAFEEMYNSLYDLIVSDIMMPQMDGFEFARSVRQVNKHIPIRSTAPRCSIWPCTAKITQTCSGWKYI